MILAIDPGPTRSALVVWNGATILAHERLANEDVHAVLRTREPGHLVVEMIASYGMAVGAEVFETCLWIGRLIELTGSRGWQVDLLPRLAVKQHLCHRGNANDANIRQALIDRFGAPRGVKCAECKGKGLARGVVRGPLGPASARAIRSPCAACGGSGWERAPGVTAGLAGDEWAAFALAVTWWDRQAVGGASSA